MSFLEKFKKSPEQKAEKEKDKFLEQIGDAGRNPEKVQDILEQIKKNPDLQNILDESLAFHAQRLGEEKQNQTNHHFQVLKSFLSLVPAQTQEKIRKSLEEAEGKRIDKVDHASAIKINRPDGTTYGMSEKDNREIEEKILSNIRELIELTPKSQNKIIEEIKG